MFLVLTVDDERLFSFEDRSNDIDRKNLIFFSPFFVSFSFLFRFVRSSIDENETRREEKRTRRNRRFLFLSKRKEKEKCSSIDVRWLSLRQVKYFSKFRYWSIHFCSFVLHRYFLFYIVDRRFLDSMKFWFNCSTWYRHSLFLSFIEFNWNFLLI